MQGDIELMRWLYCGEGIRKEPAKKGFTLIELSLSIVFIGILSLTIALIINDTVKTYRRGLTLNQVNTVGMDLVDDIRAAFQNSSSKSVKSECATIYGSASGGGDVQARIDCVNDNGQNLVSLSWNKDVSVAGNTINVPVFGAICTGSYSYIWNSGYFFNGGVGSGAATLTVGAGTDSVLKSGFRLIKVKDNMREVCLSSLVSSGYSKKNDFDGKFVAASSSNDDVVELLVRDNNDTSMALYNFEALAPAESGASNGLFYSVSFILGTVDGGIDIKKSGNFCLAPKEYNSVENFDYCVINKFNFAVQATGE